MCPTWRTTCGLHYLAQRSFDAVAHLPKKCAGSRETQHGPWKFQLNDGPHPETANGWGLLHDGHVAKRVRNVDQVAAGECARGEEYGLPESRLVSRRQTGDEPGVRGMRVEDVDKQAEDCERTKSRG